MRLGGGSASSTRPVLVAGTSVAASSIGSLAVPAMGVNMHPPTDSTSSDRHASLATRRTNLTPHPDRRTAVPTCYQRCMTAIPASADVCNEVTAFRNWFQAGSPPSGGKPERLRRCRWRRQCWRHRFESRPCRGCRGEIRKVDRGPVVARIDAFALRLRGRQQEGAVGGIAAKRRADRMIDLLRCQDRRQGPQEADRADNTRDPKSDFTHIRSPLLRSRNRSVQTDPSPDDEHVADTKDAAPAARLSAE